MSFLKVWHQIRTKNKFQKNKNFRFGVDSRPLPDPRARCSIPVSGTTDPAPKIGPTVSAAPSIGFRPFSLNQILQCKKSRSPGTFETLTSATRKLSDRNLDPNPRCSVTGRCDAGAVTKLIFCRVVMFQSVRESSHFPELSCPKLKFGFFIFFRSKSPFSASFFSGILLMSSIDTFSKQFTLLFHFSVELIKFASFFSFFFRCSFCPWFSS